MVLCFGLLFASFEGRKERRVRNWKVDRGENSALFFCGNIGYIPTYLYNPLIQESWQEMIYAINNFYFFKLLYLLCKWLYTLWQVPAKS